MGSAALFVLALAVYGMTGKLAFDPVLTAKVSENARQAPIVFLAAYKPAASLAMVIAPSATGLSREVGSFNIVSLHGRRVSLLSPALLGFG